MPHVIHPSQVRHISGAASEPGLRPRQITLPETFIIPDITKTESKNCQNKENFQIWCCEQNCNKQCHGESAIKEVSFEWSQHIRLNAELNDRTSSYIERENEILRSVLSIRELKQRRRRRQRERQKSNWFKTTTLHVHHVFCTFLSRRYTATCNVKLPKCVLSRTVTQNNKFIFLFVNFDAVL